MTTDRSRASDVRRATRDDVPFAVALHQDRIAEGFLVQLGPQFLQRLYRRIVRSRQAFLLVAERGTAATGFIAVACDTGRLYREFLLHDGVVAGLLAAPTVLRAPRRVWETLRYGTTDHPSNLPAAEILAVAVAPEAQGTGVGTALVRAAVVELRARGVTSAKVVTAPTNGAAITMYERGGFRAVTRTEVHAGVPQEVLVWP
jgi:ribosomal protein S18 acetylase RimI-like enzyme